MLTRHLKENSKGIKAYFLGENGPELGNHQCSSHNIVIIHLISQDKGTQSR